MYVSKTVLALFHDRDDESLCSPLMSGLPDIVRVCVTHDVAATFENMKRVGIDPCLAIVSSRLYPAARPNLVAALRESFPAIDVLLISSAADPLPSLQPLAADRVRHLAINPASPWEQEGNETRHQFLTAITNLMKREPWNMADYLSPGTAVHEYSVSSSTQKEELIASVEAIIAGDTGEIDLLRQRGGLLADELLENAIYNAPQLEDGSKIYRKGEERRIAPREGITFRFAFDGDMLAMEVTDHWGSLSPDMVLEYLVRNQEGGDSLDDTGGRGLFIIWRILDHFHVSITPGQQTVVGGHLKVSSPMDLETPRGFHISTHA